MAMKIRVPLRDGGTTVIRGGHQASFFHGIVGRDKARLLGTASRESLLKRGTRTTRSSVSTTARWTTAPRRPLVPRALGRGRRSATTARAGGDAEPSILPRIDLQSERTDGEATEGGACPTDQKGESFLDGNSSHQIAARGGRPRPVARSSLELWAAAGVLRPQHRAGGDAAPSTCSEDESLARADGRRGHGGGACPMDQKGESSPTFCFF